jgi:uncharacterized membrane protein YkvA (DUF1232 family)
VFDVKRDTRADTGRADRIGRRAVLDSVARTAAQLAAASGSEAEPTAMLRSRRRSRSARRRGASTIVRALTLAAFLPVASRAPIYARLVWALVREERVPARRKAVLAGAAGYFLLGRDVIADTIPVIGRLDDLVVVVLAMELFLDGVPMEIVDEKLDELGIDRAAYRRDIDQLRRLTPRPIRQLIHEVPRVVDAVVDLVAQAGVGPRPRPSS